METKRIEQISTKSGVVMSAVFGVLGYLEIVLDIDFFNSRRTADIWIVISLITCVLIFCCFLVSTMLNISRMAESVESMANLKKDEQPTEK